MRRNAAIALPVLCFSLAAGPPSALRRVDEAVKAYIGLREGAAKGLPALPREADPEQITAHQKALAERLRAARQDAQPGDVLVSEARPLLRERLDAVLSQRPAGKQKQIATGNPAHEGVRVEVAVNARYPDQAPRSSVPTAVLAVLPRLPKELEYRFYGDHLLLLDTEANLIVDFMTQAADDPTKKGRTP
jgi:hypothetical protein